jgi:predicted MFS family arabinose efflux permease
MRNVWILAAAQALAGCGMIVLFAFGGIAGAELAPTPALATLPLSLAILGVAATTIPAASAMQRWGRKPVFIGSAAFAVVSSLVCAAAIAQGSFGLLCVGAVLLGTNSSVVQQYRFAASEYVDTQHVGRAISTVMLGTLAAAVIAPEIGDRARLLGGWPQFTGSFVALGILSAFGSLVLLALDQPHPRIAAATGTPRPLGEIARQPTYLVAVLCSLCGYGVMSFLMTATPISMHVIDGMDVSASKHVMTAHLLGMYVPSLASGWLVDRLGLPRMMYLGLACNALCVAIAAFVGHHFVHYLAGLTLLGIGWNLLFVAGTALLTRTYQPVERFRAQGLHDFLTFGTQATASLLAGASIHAVGWTNLNLASVPLLLAALVAIMVWRSRERDARAAVVPGR